MLHVPYICLFIIRKLLFIVKGKQTTIGKIVISVDQLHLVGKHKSIQQIHKLE